MGRLAESSDKGGNSKNPPIALPPVEFPTFPSDPLDLSQIVGAKLAGRGYSRMSGTI